MTEERAKTIKFHYSPTTGTSYILTEMNSQPITRPRDGKIVLTTPENESEPQMNILLRSDEPKDRSHKHKGKKHKHNRGPVETRLDTKRKMGGKRMQPMTPENRHNANQVLRYCAATLNSETIRKLLNIEFPDPMYGNVSTIIDPLEDMLGLTLPTAKTPLQYGTKKRHTQQIINQDLVSGRCEKAVMQTIFTQNEPLSLPDYYELAIGDNMYIASGAPKEALQQEWNRIQRQLQKQRFNNCMNSVYYSKTRKR